MCLIDDYNLNPIIVLANNRLKGGLVAKVPFLLRLYKDAEMKFLMLSCFYAVLITDSLLIPRSCA